MPVLAGFLRRQPSLRAGHYTEFLFARGPSVAGDGAHQRQRAQPRENRPAAPPFRRGHRNVPPPNVHRVVGALLDASHVARAPKIV
ncbi:hypothetical protein MTO96_001349 [Rhipicephalus appendiculatus]